LERERLEDDEVEEGREDENATREGLEGVGS